MDAQRKKYYTAMDLEMLQLLEPNLENFKNDAKNGDHSFLTRTAIKSFQEIITMIHNLAKAREQMVTYEEYERQMVDEYLEAQISCENGHEYKMLTVVGEAKEETSGFTCNTYECRICKNYFAFPIPNNLQELVTYFETMYQKQLARYEEIKKVDNDKQMRKIVDEILRDGAEKIEDYKKAYKMLSMRRAEIVKAEEQVEFLFNNMLKILGYDSFN